MAGTSSKANPSPNNPAAPYHDDQLMKPYEFFFNIFPRGYRFKPTDEELIHHYLMNKLLNMPLPTNKIVDLNVYEFSPMQLAERHKFREEESMYFFSPRVKKYPNGNRLSRITGDGHEFWKATGNDNEIYHERDDKKKLIGTRKTLVFYIGKPKRGEIKTDWIMHEYIIKKSIALTSTTNRAPDGNRLDDWVLCKIYLSKNSKKKNPDSGHAEKIETTESVPLEQDLPAVHESCSATQNLGEQDNTSTENEQALNNGAMTEPYRSTSYFESQQVTDLGARSYAHHQRDVSLLRSASQLPVINSVSDAISSLTGGDNNNGTMTTSYDHDGSNGHEHVLNLAYNFNEHNQQDLPSLQNTLTPSIIDSIESAIASLAGGPVFPDMPFGQELPQGVGAQNVTEEAPRNGSQAYQSSPDCTNPPQSLPSLDNGCLPPLPQSAYYLYDERDYGFF